MKWREHPPALDSWEVEEIDPQHRDEWISGSGISQEITELNLQSLTGQEAIETITSKRLESAGGHGQQYVTSEVGKVLSRYEHLDAGGWWCSATGDSGCLKPNTPRKNDKGELIKYENPLGVPCGVFQLQMPDENYWADRQRNCSETIVITEGAKKAAALLTCGIPAVAVAGIWNGTPKDDRDQHCLHPYLKRWAQHRIVICFDYSEKARGRRDVSNAALRLAHQLYANGSPWVGTAHCKGPEKGIDDLLVAQGHEAVHSLIASAQKVDVQRELEDRKKPELIRQAANAYLDCDDEAERAAIRSEFCTTQRISNRDFSSVVNERLALRHPQRKLESRPLTPDELDAEPVDEARTFFDQLLTERWSTLIGGNRGSTKTILTLQLMVALMKQRSPDVIGLRPEATGLRVLYVCSDAMAERIKSYLIEMGYWNDLEVRNGIRIWGNSQTQRKWTIGDLDGLQQQMEAFNPNVVVIDSLKGALGPALEDISRPIIRHHMDAVHDIVLRSAALLWIHHANKSGTIADNEALQEAPDIVYLLEKDQNELVNLKPIKCRGGQGIRRQYKLQGDFLWPEPTEQTKTSDVSKVNRDVMEYVRKQNQHGIKPSIKTVIEGLPHHSPEAVKSCIKRLRGKQWLLSTRDPSDLRSCLLGVSQKFYPPPPP
ncbi:hypothetical protein CWE17_08750 [Synechococcus sp. BS56D]|uniref:DUF3854 domain-containing protein n=1 Tax=Synechococcus sp. BS56D TaxID=2055944 RepID=UPI00103D1610|nr:DUF3854 domain-containing protein [Synechococcus sp. BS56D]TCD56744.1 hypothetical protein CWE17_08750 [Synechococcus sp. BS56D]